MSLNSHLEDIFTPVQASISFNLRSFLDIISHIQINFSCNKSTVLIYVILLSEQIGQMSWLYSTKQTARQLCMSTHNFYKFLVCFSLTISCQHNYERYGAGWPRVIQNCPVQRNWKPITSFCEKTKFPAIVKMATAKNKAALWLVG